jgi:hypothetical protein
MKLRFTTIRSPLYDSFFFVFPFWVTAVYALLVRSFPMHEAAVFLLLNIALGESHFASTWMIYLDPQNRAYYAGRKWAFYYVPVFILTACVLLAYGFGLGPLAFVASVVSAVHVTRQSTGIAALYRGKSGNRDERQRFFDNYAVYFGSAFFLGVGFIRFYLGGEPGGLLTPLLATSAGAWLRAGAYGATTLAGALCAGFTLRSLIGEAKRARGGEPLSVSRLVVLLYSILLYSPYAFATRIEHANAMGVGIHYVQYLGIVWLLNGNKYPLVAGVADPGLAVLANLSQRRLVRVGYFGIYGAIVLALRQNGFNFDQFTPQSWLYGIPIGFQVCHYHVEAFIWKFSNPFIRESVLKYLQKPA